MSSRSHPLPEDPLPMLIDQLLHLFCTIDDLCKPIEASLAARALGGAKARRPTRTPSLSTSEVITILVSFHLSHYRTFKRYYTEFVAVHLRAEFPKAPSYQRFVEYIARAVAVLVSLVPRLFGQPTGISYIDSTPLPVCHNQRILSHRVFAGLAKRGKTSVGWFFGMKLHLVVSHEGELLAVRLTAGNRADLAETEALSKRLFGLLFGDKGYIGQDVRERLAKRGVRLLTKVRRKMKPLRMTAEERRYLRGRGLVETVIGELKAVCQISHSRHRSRANFLAHLLSGLAAYCFLPEKPKLRLRKRTERLAKETQSIGRNAA